MNFYKIIRNSKKVQKVIGKEVILYMAKINFDIEMNGIQIHSYMKLEGQQLYFFEQRSEKEKQGWIKSYLKGISKITNIEIEK